MKKFNNLKILLFIFLLSCSEKKQFKSLYNPEESDYYIADDVAGHLHQPNALREFEWKEHQTGKMQMKTNNLGFREDEETAEEKNAIRILVTGDSHTDGVVYNSESFCNQLEKILNEKEKKYEVVNGGVGYYGPQNYTGFLKKFLYLKPDIFVVAIYTGNDFLDAIKIETENARMVIPERPTDYFNDLWILDEKLPGYTGQLINQIKFFKTFPDLKFNVLEIFENRLTVIKKICSEENIKLLVIVIPSKIDIEPQTTMIDSAMKIMSLSEDDLNINKQFSDELVQWLSKENIQFIDFSEELKKHNEELYWKQDLHLNNNGHKAVAEIIFNSKKI